MAETGNHNIPQKVLDLFNKGFAAHERGNLDYAIDMFTECIEIDPTFLQARKFLRAAEIQNFKKNRGGFLSHVISTVSGIPITLQAVALLKANKPVQALQAVEKLLRKDPLNMTFINLFAKAAVAANLVEVAIQTLTIAREYHPNDALIVEWLGKLYLQTNQAKQARECLEILCQLRPNDPTAVKALKDATALESMTRDGWVLAAEAGSYRDVMKDTKEAVVLEKEGKAVKSMDDIDILIQETIAKIERQPNNMNYYLALARLYADSKRFSKAIDTLEKAQQISGGDPQVAAILSTVQVQRLNDEIADLHKSDNEQAAVAKEHERDSFVFNDIQERVRRYPNDLQLRYEMGVMLYERQKLNEAIQQFQLSQRSPKHRIKSLYYIAVCFKQKKQYDMAKEQFEQAAAELPTMDDTKKDIYYMLGEVFEAMGQMDKAAECYKKIYQVDIAYKDIARKIDKVYKGC